MGFLEIQLKKGKTSRHSVIRRCSFFLAGLDWKGIGAVLFAFIVTRAMIIIVLYFSMAIIPIEKSGEAWRYNPRNLIADGLIRQDSRFYISIADHGYDLTPDKIILWDSKFYIPIDDHGYNVFSVAFFPLYPLFIRIASLITGNLVTSGLWVSNISFLIALFYLYAVTKQEFNDHVATRTIFYLAAAPSAFFFSAVYSESTFLLFMIACFYYAQKKKWIWAGLAGALASATRMQGIILGVFLLIEALWQQGVRFFPKPYSLIAHIFLLQNNIIKISRAWKGIFASIFSTSGLIAYMTYLYVRFGDPLFFLHIQTNWGRTLSFEWIPRLVQRIVNTYKWSGNIFSGEIFEISLLMDTLFTLVFIPIVIVVFFNFRPSFSLFTFFSFILPLTTATTLSMQRFVLCLIPCFMLLAFWGKRLWVDRLIIGISLPLQAYFLILFSHWFWAG